MPTFEERMAYLEGRVEEHSRNVDGIREAVANLERRTDARFVSLEQRTEAFGQRVDHHFEAVDRRFEGLERRLDGLDEKMTRYFVWLVGMQVTTLAAVVAALVGR